MKSFKRISKKNVISTLFKSFRVKIVSLMLILMLLPLIISIIYISHTTYDQIYNDVTIQQMDRATYLNMQIQTQLNEMQQLTDLLATSSMIKSMDFDKMHEFLQATLHQYPIIDGIFVIREDGMQVYHSDGKEHLGDRSDREYFQKGMQGKSGFTDILISKTTGKPIIIYATPIKNGNKIIGVMNINLSLDGITTNLIANQKHGKTGYAYIVDHTGKLIAHPNEKLVEKITDFSNLIPVQNLLKGKTGRVEYDLNGTKKLATYLPIETTNWGIVVEIDSEEAFASLNNQMNTFYMIIFISLIISLIASNIAGKYIINPIKELNKKINFASKGELKQANLDGKILKRKDEFGYIASSFNNMIKSIGSLIEDIKNSTKIVLNSSNSLAGITSESTIAMNEISSTMEEITSSASEQANQTEEGVSKVHDLANKIEMVTNATKEMDTASKTVTDLIQKGLLSVNTLGERSQENTQANVELNNTIMKVDTSAQEIGVIIEAIGQIAKQTNLLSLNAAIEAARAGEHGKGFAVVAEEIRKLAEQSSQSAQKIRDLIIGIQEQSKSAVQSMETAKSISDAETLAVKETENAFKNISLAIDTLTKKIKEINEHNNQMDSSKEALVDIISSIAAATQQTSAATQEVSASTQEQLASTQQLSAYTEDLKMLAGQLETLIEKFNI